MGRVCRFPNTKGARINTKGTRKFRKKGSTFKLNKVVKTKDGGYV